MADKISVTNKPQKLVIIGYVWPEPNSSAAGTRMMQLIDLFLQNHWQITFASPAKLGDHRFDLQQIGVNEQAIELNDSSFDQFIEKIQPDCVIFDRFMMEEQFGWRVERFAPSALRILNTEDLHSLRDCRQQAVKQHLKDHDYSQQFSESLLDSDKLFTAMANSDMAKREIASIFRSDLTLMISAFEMQLLQQQFQVPAKLLLHLPFFFKAEPAKHELNSWQQRQHFISIGNFRHAPNWDAVLWLKQQIWPLIRQQLPNAELHIYGAYPPPKATALHNAKQGFLIKGWAEDALHVISQARVCLAPLRFGAGIKGKLADAMQTGTPSITTNIGAESMLANNNHWPGEIANDAASFAKQAIALYQDQLQWNQAQQLALNNFQQNFQSTVKAQSFLQQLAAVKTNIEQHRLSNFIGSMLNHHHHKSTQYMAQWIEAKNKIADKSIK